MKYRKLINGSKVPELTGTWEWIFESKCPAKWLHIDCENGRIYVQSTKGKGSQWEEPSDALLDAGFQAITDEAARRKGQS